MSEDEAFIRTIVDSPGDDLPRLVYADWLDERSDPRGAYLRAEVEWAKPWRDGHPPGWSKRQPGRSLPEWSQDHWEGLEAVRLVGKGLDPLWIARISRPPAGVCCDHVTFEHSPSILTEDDVGRAEARYGHSFPVPFRAFLLNYNGGPPSRRQLIVRSGSDEDGWDWSDLCVTSFAWIPPSAAGAEPDANTLEALQQELEYMQTELGGWGVPQVTADYVPLGQTASTGVLLLELKGSLAVFDLVIDDGGAVPTRLTASLPELLARIVTDPI